MNRLMRLALVVFVVAIVPFTQCCARREGTAGGVAAATHTIAPAAAQPAPTGTDAMTQTVDVEDGRSESDGAATSDAAAPAAGASAADKGKPATTAARPRAATPAHAKPRKH